MYIFLLLAKNVSLLQLRTSINFSYSTCAYFGTYSWPVTRVLRRVLVRVSSPRPKARGAITFLPRPPPHPRINFEATSRRRFFLSTPRFFSTPSPPSTPEYSRTDLRKGRGSSLQPAEPVLRTVEVCYCTTVMLQITSTVSRGRDSPGRAFLHAGTVLISIPSTSKSS